jgi:UDP-glucose 4-epimerase
MSSVAGRKAIVTGGAGFIGSNLVDALVNQGASVTVLDNLSSGSRENLNPKATFVLGGVEDKEAVSRAIGDVDLVYHLAADTATRETSMGWNEPTRTLEHDIVGALNLFQAIETQNHHVRVIMASSAAVYGEPISTPVSEDHPTNPLSPYGISKLAAEKLAFAYFKEFGIDVVVIRIFNTYGPRQHRYVIFELLKKLRTKPSRLEVLGTPTTIRDYCYISDMVDALLLASAKGAGGEVYNVSGQNPVTIQHLVELILAQLDLTSKVDVQYTGKSWKGDIHSMVGDISKIKKLGFRPEVSLEKGLRRMLDSEWWKAAVV